MTDLEREGDIAADFLEELLDIADLDGDIDMDVEGDRAVVSIDGGDDLDTLVGADGAVLDAIQELTRLAVQQELGDRSRLMLDIAGWRAAKRESLTEAARVVAKRVLESADSEEMDPMSPFERKIVHDAIAEIDGVDSDSTGVEPHRRVVVLPA